MECLGDNVYISFPIISCKAVSYTHLDVYKRQAYNIIINNTYNIIYNKQDDLFKIVHLLE